MTKYVIRRVIQAIPVLFGITIVVYGILLAAPGGPTARFAQQPAHDPGAARRRSRRPGASTSRSRSSTAAGWASATPRRSRDVPILSSLPAPAAFIGPTGWPNFLPTAISGADERRAPRRLRLLDHLRREVVERSIARAALPTFILAGVALVIWITVAIFLGVYVRDQTLLAVRQRRDDLLLRRLRHAHVLARASC